MKKIKEMLKDKKFYFLVLIIILFFGIFAKMDYATDTYSVFASDAKEIIKHFFASGRFITGICQTIVVFFNFNNTLTYVISYTLAITSISIAVYKLSKILDKYINNYNISAIISILTIINVFSIELFLFIEKGIIVFSVLLNVLALEKLLEYFDGSKKAVVWVAIYMLLANFCYQGTVALFVSLALIFILKYSKDIKDFIKNNVVTALLYGIPALINYIIVKFVFTNARMNGKYDILLSVTKVSEGIKSMFNTYSILPKYVFIIAIIATIGIIVYSICKQKNNMKDKAIQILGIAYIIVGALCVTILPQFMQATDSIWFVARSSYAFGGIVGLLLAYLFVNFKVNVKFEKIILIMVIVYLAIQYNSFQVIARDHYILNYMDKYQAGKIQEMIEEYEEKTGEKITKVAFYQSKTPNWSYPNLKSTGDINIKAMYPEWSRIPYLQYYLNRDFEKVDKSEEIYEEYFEGKDWKYFSDEQVVLIEDTLHLYVY